MNLRERNSIRNDWVTEPLILIGDDVCGIKQHGSGRRAARYVFTDFRKTECLTTSI